MAVDVLRDRGALFAGGLGGLLEYGGDRVGGQLGRFPVEQAVEQGGPPDMEATKRRAFRFYEEALALKSSPADIGLTD